MGRAGLGKATWLWRRNALYLRHPEAPERSEGLEGRRPGPCILRGAGFAGHLRMTEQGWRLSLKDKSYSPLNQL
jgi:hypothetical protein